MGEVVAVDAEDISSELNELELVDESEASESGTVTTMYDYLFNVIIVGDSGVGKTDLIGRLCDVDYQTKLVTTMGMNVENHILDANDKKIKLQLWDPSGSEKYIHVTKKYFSNASGIMFVYDVTYYKSFHNIFKWIEIVNQQIANPDIPKILVGNKCDIKRRSVTTEEGKKLAESAGMAFLETSAITGQNVAEAFSSLCQVMISAEEKTFSEAVVPVEPKKLS